ncbi:hypothetical protein Tco_1238679 [Tanacetum coccineum]
MTQSQPIEFTQGTYRTPSAPRPPNPIKHQGESSAPHKLTIIRIQRRSQSDPDTPITTAAEIIIASLDEATQISITTARSLEDLDAQQNVKIVKEHLADEEIEKIMKEPMSHKERAEVEKSTNLITINDEEEEESDEDALRRKKGKGIKEIKNTSHHNPYIP